MQVNVFRGDSGFPSLRSERDPKDDCVYRLSQIAEVSSRKNSIFERSRTTSSMRSYGQTFPSTPLREQVCRITQASPDVLTPAGHADVQPDTLPSLSLGGVQVNF